MAITIDDVKEKACEGAVMDYEMFDIPDLATSFKRDVDLGYDHRRAWFLINYFQPHEMNEYFKDFADRMMGFLGLEYDFDVMSEYKLAEFTDAEIREFVRLTSIARKAKGSRKKTRYYIKAYRIAQRFCEHLGKDLADEMTPKLNEMLEKVNYVEKPARWLKV